MQKITKLFVKTLPTSAFSMRWRILFALGVCFLICLKISMHITYCLLSHVIVFCLFIKKVKSFKVKPSKSFHLDKPGPQVLALEKMPWALVIQKFYSFSIDNKIYSSNINHSFNGIHALWRKYFIFKIQNSGIIMTSNTSIFRKIRWCKAYC